MVTLNHWFLSFDPNGRYFSENETDSSDAEEVPDDDDDVQSDSESEEQATSQSEPETISDSSSINTSDIQLNSADERLVIQK